MAVEQVRSQELSLLSTLSDIEQLENHGKQVCKAQTTNLEELTEINTQQEDLIKELDIIEVELDSFING